MNLYQTRVKLRTGAHTPRGSGEVEMVHHFEFPTDSDASQFTEALAVELETDVMSQRWTTLRGTTYGANEVITFSRNVETGHCEPLTTARWDLGELLSVGNITIPSSPFVLTDVGARHGDPDPTAACTVVELGYRGTVETRGRCYVGPMSHVSIAGGLDLGVPILGTSLVQFWGYAPTYDEPPGWPGANPGLWSVDVATFAAEWVRGLHVLAEDFGGRKVIYSAKFRDTAQVVRWQPALVKAHLRSRGWPTVMGPKLTR